MARDNLCYRDTKCCEQLYQHNQHLNLFHPKDVGILQFTKIGHARGDDERRLLKLQEYSNPTDNMLKDMLNEDPDILNQAKGANKQGDAMKVKKKKKESS